MTIQTSSTRVAFIGIVFEVLIYQKCEKHLICEYGRSFIIKSLITLDICFLSLPYFYKRTNHFRTFVEGLRSYDWISEVPGVLRVACAEIYIDSVGKELR